MSSPRHDPSLPPSASESVFVVSGSVVINAPRDKVWPVLSDFASYSEWNPFVRTIQITNDKYQPTEDQTLAEGKHIHMIVHIPPSMEAKAFSVQSAKVLVNHLDHENYRVAWKQTIFPEWLLNAQRWQGLTVIDASEGGGQSTRYESVEAFSGILAYVMRFFLKTGLEKSFQAMAEGLKKRVEEKLSATNNS